MASAAGHIPSNFLFVYAMTKAFIVYFTAGIYEESKEKIDILSVCPGFVKTRLIDFKRPSFDTISVQTCVSGILKDLGQEQETNTCFIHEFLISKAKVLWQTSNELNSLFYNQLNKFTKVLDDFNAKGKQLKVNQ